MNDFEKDTSTGATEENRLKKIIPEQVLRGKIMEVNPFDPAFVKITEGLKVAITQAGIHKVNGTNGKNGSNGTNGSSMNSQSSLVSKLHPPSTLDTGTDL